MIMTKPASTIKLLPVGYRPSPDTVIIGRGKEPRENPGNQRLRLLAIASLQRYQQGDKKCKTQIVSDIIAMIRDACKGGKGAFVKHDKPDGRWYDLGDNVAREKVGYVFRDLLADEYKSSSKSKVARRNSPPIAGLKSTLEQFKSMLEQQDEAILGNHEDNFCLHYPQEGNMKSVNETAINVLSIPEPDPIRFDYVHGGFQSIGGCSAPVNQCLSQAPAMYVENDDDSLASSTRSSFCLADEDTLGFDYEALLRLPLLDDSPTKESAFFY